MESSLPLTSTDEPLLSARETARRLGIKLDTLYAYVSRGLLASVAVPGSRERRYRVGDVERFRAGRGGERAREALMPVIDSAISLIEDGRFYYRGRDAIELADWATLEEVAALLWSGAAEPPRAPTLPSPACGGGLSHAAPQLSPLPRKRGTVGAAVTEPAGLIERCQVRLAYLSMADLAALDLNRGGVIRTGGAILAELVDIVGANPDGRASGCGPTHRRLAAAWGLDETGADLVRRALVLVADHELNASTFVARCVASTAATPYAVVSAALSALSGRRHGGASARAEALFREIGAQEPLAAMAARLARGDPLPGLGQPLYPNGDPRAAAILAAITAALPERGARIGAAAKAAHELTGEHPNIDFALGALTVALGLPPGAALGLFVLGRTVGWIAHAIEQYDSGILIRPRARYTGSRQ